MVEGDILIMKMIRIIWLKYPEGNNTQFWMKEKNPFFNWYKENPLYKVSKEIELD